MWKYLPYIDEYQSQSTIQLQTGYISRWKVADRPRDPRSWLLQRKVEQPTVFSPAFYEWLMIHAVFWSVSPRSLHQSALC